MQNKPFDFRSTVGIMLRGKNIYGGGGNSPNPAGNNQYSTAAKLALKRRKAMKNGTRS
jgi:hypothetical protein